MNAESPEAEFLAIDETLTSAGPDAMLSRLAESLRDADRPHEWFEVLKMLIRHRLQLPLLYSDPEEDQSSAEQRAQLEEGLLEACREVGNYLLARGRLRDAWNYLRPLGTTAELTESIRTMAVTDENSDQLIELCFYEKLAPERGFELLLERYGTCNAITTLHAHARNLSRAQRRTTAERLIGHLYGELTANVARHVEQHDGAAPAGDRLAPLLDNRPWLFADRGYHVDTSHLSSTVQLGREAGHAAAWEQAWELTEYGIRLAPELQYPADAPFEETYPAHRHYYQVLLDRERPSSLEYFAARARAADVYQQTTFAVEVYVDLLVRIGRPAEGIETYLQLIPHDVTTTGLIVSPLHLAEQCGEFARVMEFYRRHNRLLEYGAAVALQAQHR